MDIEQQIPGEDEVAAATRLITRFFFELSTGIRRCYC